MMWKTQQAIKDYAIRAARIHPAFIRVTGLKCSCGKISSPLTEIPVGKTEISGTEPAHPLIRTTHRKFYKGFIGQARSRKQGSCEETLRNLKRWIALSSGYISVQCIMQLISQVLIRWTMIYPVDRTIQGLNNRCLASYRFTCPVSSNSL